MKDTRSAFTQDAEYGGGIGWCCDAEDITKTSLTSFACNNVNFIIDEGMVSGYLDLGDVMNDNTSLGVGDSFDADGTYLGRSVMIDNETHHFWDGAEIAGNVYVIGNLKVYGPLKVEGELYVKGDLTTNDDVEVSEGITAEGTISIYGNDVRFTCRGLADVKNIKIFGTVRAEGTFVLYGSLEIEHGSLEIDQHGTLSFVRGSLHSLRLVVNNGTSIHVCGILDASQLASSQIMNKGEILSREFGGTVDIYYDIYVFVNGNDRSDGELAVHGKDVTVHPHTNGTITSADVTINGVLIDTDSYEYDENSVTVFADALDRRAGDIEISVRSDEKNDISGEADKKAFPHPALAIPTMMFILSKLRGGL